MLLLFLPQLGKVVTAVFVLLDPLPGESSILNVGQSLLHCGPRGVTNNFFATRQVSVLSRVRNRVAHPSQPTFVDQVDDQLHLVQTFEISNLRCVAGLDQRLESLLDQRSQSATQY